MIKPYGAQTDDEDRDPYKGFSDSTADQPDQPPQSAEPKPYTPPVAAPQKQPKDAPPPAPTFAQMQEQGHARPPMPTPAPVEIGDSQPQTLPQFTPRRNGFLPPDFKPSTIATVGDDAPPVGTSIGDANPDVPITTVGDIPGYGDAPQQTLPTPDVPGDGDAPPTDTPIAIDDGILTRRDPYTAKKSILDMLTGGASGDKTPLQTATEKKALDQLNGSSPYDSKAVRDEYDWLSGNIDDQFAGDVRSTDNAMAARGLYGSAGKDFHSGRLSDLNVGKRSAKASLAQDLGNKFATSKGQYDANAITQGQSVSGQGDAQQRAWLNQLMGYGNDAFNHDLASAEFGQRQNESEQDFLLRMLQMGYGV